MATAQATNLLEAKPKRRIRLNTESKGGNSKNTKQGTAGLGSMEKEFEGFIGKMRRRREFNKRQMFLPGFDKLFMKG